MYGQKTKIHNCLMIDKVNRPKKFKINFMMCYFKLPESIIFRKILISNLFTAL